jgi:hypothetical protein
MPARQLVVAQFGQESTWATAVVATAKLMGLTDGNLDFVPKHVHPDEMGRMGPSAIIALTEAHATGKLTYTLTYEDILYLLEAAFGTATPSGAGPYTRNYSAPVAAVVSPKLFSIEFGATGASYVMPGALLAKGKISGEAGDLWKAETDWLGKSVATVSLAALSDRTVNPIRMSDTVLSIDTWAGTIGTTAVPATLVSFELDFDTTRHLKVFGGALNPGDHGEKDFTCTLKTVFEFNATAKAYFDALIASGGTLTQRQLRLKATSGTSIAQLDFAGTLVDPDALSQNRDGNMTMTLNWEGTYNTTLGNYLKAQSVNGVATLV